MGSSTLLSEADLHGLVDGCLEPHRRAEVMRRAALSARDRALVEEWQDQSDAIRGAFASVESERLPATLDLRKAIASRRPDPVPPGRPARVLVRIAAILVAVTAGLAGAWAIASSRPAATNVAASGDPLPTTTIPDLSGAGFTFVSAESRGPSLDRLEFRYRQGAERVVLDATRADGIDDAALLPDGAGFAWTSRGVAYRLSGTPATKTLRMIAASLLSRDRPD